MEYIEYIKALILGLIVGVSSPLPVSSSAHLFLTNNLLGFSQDKNTVSFYYFFFMLTFSVVILVSFKNIYIKTFKGALKKKKSYSLRMKNMLISLAISLLLFVPLGGYGSIIDSFDRFMLSGNLLNPILICIGCVFSGVMLMLCLWSAKNTRQKGKKTVSFTDCLKTAIYSLPSFVIPGFSRVSSGSVNLILRDVNPASAMREAYFYLAPQLLTVSIIKVISTALQGVSFDPIVLSVGIIACALANFLVITLLRKVSIKKLFGFFGIYSILLGVSIVAQALIQ